MAVAVALWYQNLGLVASKWKPASRAALSCTARLLGPAVSKAEGTCHCACDEHLGPQLSLRVENGSANLNLPARKLRPKLCLRSNAVQCVRRGESRGYRWKGRSGKRRHVKLRLRASVDPDSNPLGEEGFWDRAEGNEKLKEIEEMKELLAEAEKLQSTGKDEAQGTGASSEASAEEQAEKFREELAMRAKEQAERRKQAEKMLQLGQQAYGKGMYDRSVELFEAALTNIPGVTNLGGEIQIWLAIAYEAHNRHGDCIALYKNLEKTHPNKSIRRQAKDLRYILEAPKLKISKDEMVTIPLIDPNYDSDTRTWSQMYRDRKKKTAKKESTRDYLADWLVWNPPRWERSPYFWVAVTIWLTLVGISLMFQD